MGKFFLLFQLLLFPLLLSAQFAPSLSTGKVTSKIVYDASGNPESGPTNKVLTEMARHVLLEPWNVNLFVRLTIKTKWISSKGSENLQITWHDPSIEGPKGYRGFSLSETLFPSQISLKLRIASRMDTTGYTDQQLFATRIKSDDLLLFDLPVTGFDGALDTILIRDVHFFYDSGDFERLVTTKRCIDDYFAAIAQVERMEQLALSVNCSVDSLMPLNFLRIDEINKVLIEIKRKNFSDNLPGPDTDPLHLKEKFTSLLRTSRTLTYNYCDAIRSREALEWNHDPDGLADYFTERVLNYIEMSQWMDDHHSDIYAASLIHCFDTVTFPAEMNIPELLMRKMYPDAAGDTLAGYFSNVFLRSYLRLAGALIERHKFAEGVTLLEHAKRMPLYSSSGKETVAMNSLLARASTEVFNAFVIIASGSMRNGKFDMADRYLTKAREYRDLHPGLIPADTLYNKVFSELFFKRNSSCDQLLGNKQFSNALDCYLQFRQHYTEAELLPVTESLKTKEALALKGMAEGALKQCRQALDNNQPDSLLYWFDEAHRIMDRAYPDPVLWKQYDTLTPVAMRLRYEKHLIEGALALEKRQYTMALHHFDMADSLAVKHALTKDPLYDSLYPVAMKYHLLIDLSMARKKIWESHFEDALATLDTIRERGKAYGLEYDPEFIKNLTWFVRMIDEQRCRDLTDSVVYSLIRAESAIRMNRFIAAGQSFQQALSFADTMSSCGIPRQPITDSIRKYRNAIQYQENLTMALRLMVEGQYDSTLTILQGCDRLYFEDRLDKLGCQALFMDDFITERNNPYLTTRAISFHLGRKEAREALRYLQMLERGNIPPAETRKLQQELGRMLAQRDFQETKGSIPLTEQNENISGNKWFRVLREAYRIAWNQLQQPVSAKIGQGVTMIFP